MITCLNRSVNTQVDATQDDENDDEDLKYIGSYLPPSADHSLAVFECDMIEFHLQVVSNNDFFNIFLHWFVKVIDFDDFSFYWSLQLDHIVRESEHEQPLSNLPL